MLLVLFVSGVPMEDSLNTKKVDGVQYILNSIEISDFVRYRFYWRFAFLSISLDKGAYVIVCHTFKVTFAHPEAGSFANILYDFHEEW